VTVVWKPRQVEEELETLRRSNLDLRLRISELEASGHDRQEGRQGSGALLVSENEAGGQDSELKGEWWREFSAPYHGSENKGSEASADALELRAMPPMLLPSLTASEVSTSPLDSP
jgi:hypothetical protein